MLHVDYKQTAAVCPVHMTALTIKLTLMIHRFLSSNKDTCTSSQLCISKSSILSLSQKEVGVTEEDATSKSVFIRNISKTEGLQFMKGWQVHSSVSQKQNQWCNYEPMILFHLLSYSVLVTANPPDGLMMSHTTLDEIIVALFWHPPRTFGEW